MFCRSAVEAAAANIVRRRAAEHGTDLEQADEQIAEARTLRETLALVLFGDAGRQGEVGREIRAATARPPRRSSPSSTRAPTATSLDPRRSQRLPESTRDLIHDLRR